MKRAPQPWRTSFTIIFTLIPNEINQENNHIISDKPFIYGYFSKGTALKVKPKIIINTHTLFLIKY